VHHRRIARLARAEDIASVLPDRGARDSEAQSGSAGNARSRRIGAEERLEHVGEMIGGDADAGIGDDDLRVVGSLADADSDPPSIGVVLDRIRHDVGDGVLQRSSVAQARDRLGVDGDVEAPRRGEAVQARANSSSRTGSRQAGAGNASARARASSRSTTVCMRADARPHTSSACR
jgi:hypothetical protein